MSTTAPPRPDISNSSRKGVLSKANFLGFLDFSRARNSLKLRKQWDVSKQLTIEAGLDYKVQTDDLQPWAGVKMLLNADKPESWALEFNTDWVILNSPFVDVFGFTDRLSLPINARVGTDFYNDNKPHIEIGVKNKFVVIGMLVGCLVTKKPAKISIKRKEVGGFDFSVPLTGDKNDISDPVKMNQRFELDGSIRREGARILCDLAEINAIFRLKDAATTSIQQ